MSAGGHTITAMRDEAGPDAGHLAGRDASFKAQIFAGQISTLYGLAETGRFTPLILMGLLTIYFWDQTHWIGPLLPISMQALGTSGLEYLRHHYFRRPQPAHLAPVWARHHLLLSGVTGLSWALTSMVWFDAASLAHQALLAVMILGVSTGSVISRAPYLPSCALHVGLTALPLLALLALAPTDGSLVIAIGGAFYLVWLSNAGLVMNREHQATIGLRHENADLIAHLTDARLAESEARIAAERARDAAEAGNRAKSEFLAVVSHELRTPLHGILGMAGVLESAELELKHRQALTTIREAGEALSTIIDDLLDLSRLEAGRIRLDPQEMDVRRVIDSVVRMLRTRAWEKQLSISVAVSPDVPERIAADPGRIRQVLLNLVGNAIKFTERGGIAITAQPDPERSGFIRLGVEDTGIGIQADAIQRLFNPFTQADQGYARKYGGAGLGLSISKRLVGLMQGEIGVLSSLGLGSTFWFSIPVTVSAFQPREGVHFNEEAHPFRPLRVLVIDDHEIARRTMEAVLIAAGHQVTLAGSAEEALKLIDAGPMPFDAAIADLDMPRMSGVEFVRAVRARASPAERLPVVLISGHGPDHPGILEAAALRLPVLTKPSKPAVILEALENAAAPIPAFSAKPQDDLSTILGWLDTMGPQTVQPIVQSYLDAAEDLFKHIAGDETSGAFSPERSAQELAGLAGNLGLAGLSVAARALAQAHQGQGGRQAIHEAHARLNQAVQLVHPALWRLANGRTQQAG